VPVCLPDNYLRPKAWEAGWGVISKLKTGCYSFESLHCALKQATTLRLSNHSALNNPYSLNIRFECCDILIKFLLYFSSVPLTYTLSSCLNILVKIHTNARNSVFLCKPIIPVMQRFEILTAVLLKIRV
jgi:hypothetical protein